jgi:hypothetical protein
MRNMLCCRRYHAIEDDMTALSESGDHSQMARLGKEFSELGRTVEMNATRQHLVHSIEEMNSMRAENNR